LSKYVCSVCSYVYDEAKGIPEAGINPGTLWDDIPDDWVCPLCGAPKTEFNKLGITTAKPDPKPQTTIDMPTDIRELSPLEISAICSNFARGCEKQYKEEESKLFTELSQYFKKAAKPAENPNFDQLMELVEKDLNEGFPYANAVAIEDRGARRALTWSEKVTRILKSLLTRYQKEGDAMLENTGVYICTICGFIYVGDNLPDLCPVCKVPNWKFEKVEGREQSA
jgi:rubredoxin